MSGKWTGSVVFLVGLAMVATTTRTAIAADSVGLAQEVDEARTNFASVCCVAWRFSNLRPPLMRAASLRKFLTPLSPSDPMVDLSVGSPKYRMLVGQLAYWGSLCASRSQRLNEVFPALGASGVDEEIPPAEREWDYAKADYLRACAWAWPYPNLRPLCGAPGFEPGEFLNPFVPSDVGRVELSPADPDYTTIVCSLRECRAKMTPAGLRLEDLVADRKAATDAAKRLQGMKPAAPDDRRLARMSDILDQFKPILKQCREDRRAIDDLIMPWHVAAVTAENLPTAEAQASLAKIVDQIQQLRQDLQKDQAALAQQSDDSVEQWVHLCDIFGRLGRATHEKAMPVLDQWIAEEPRLWQPYLARAAARLHSNQTDLALDDLKRVGSKLALYDSRPQTMVFFNAIRGYALCKMDEQPKIREGVMLIKTAKELDNASWVPPFVHGWACLERHKYSTTMSDLQLALRNSDNAPQAEIHEAMALLLAACPQSEIRDGKKALDHAIQACKLTHGRDWVCLDTLGAAYAESGDFDLALKYANQALDLAPAESQDKVAQRIELYKEKKPYRLE